MSKNAYVQDGDVGCGAPGSLSWHKCAVAELTVYEQADYFREVSPDMSDHDKLAFAIYLIVEQYKSGNGN